MGGKRSLTSQRNGGGDRVNKPNCFFKNRFATKLSSGRLLQTKGIYSISGGSTSLDHVPRLARK